jgi:hypothetical protein
MTSPTLIFSAESEASLSQLERPGSARLGSAKSSRRRARSSQTDSLASSTPETFESVLSLPGFEDAPCSLAASHASPGLMPGSDEARRITATSGRQCAMLSTKSGRLGSLVKMCLESSAWGSSRCAVIWKTSVTPRNRLLFRLARLEHGTSESASGLLPTLTIAGNYNRKGVSEKSGDGLATALIRLLPTLLAPDGDKGPTKFGRGNLSLRGTLHALTGGQRGPLNPRWCEWFMGYPDGHTELKASATQSFPRSRSSSSASSPRSRAAKRKN